MKINMYLLVCVSVIVNEKLFRFDRFVLIYSYFLMFVSQVTVTFNTVDGTALSGIDYVLMSNQVTLLRSQTSAAIPIRIIDDSLPEVAETFLVQLDQVSGGGVLGTVTSTSVIIEASDDPNGAFGKLFDIANRSAYK